MSSISFLLLSSDVIHHVSDKVGDISHWGFTVHLEGDGVEEVSTKFGVIDSVKSFLKFIVASKEWSGGKGACNKGDQEYGFHCFFKILSLLIIFVVSVNL
jgi:hypothetical protein